MRATTDPPWSGGGGWRPRVYCPDCGTQIPDGGRFCPECGADAMPAEPPQEPPGATAAAPALWTPPTYAPVMTAPGAATQPASASPSAGLPKAPLFPRLVAVSIDGLIVQVLLLPCILWVVADAVRGLVPIGGIAVTTLASLWLVVYSLVKDGWKGASFGKRLVGQMVVSLKDGRPEGMGPSVIRNLILNLIAPIEAVLVFVDRRGQRLGDKAAGAQVVRTADYMASVPGYLPAGRTAAILVVVGSLVVGVGGSVAGTVALATALGQASVRPVGGDVTSDTGSVTPTDMTGTTPGEGGAAAQQPPGAKQVEGSDTAGTSSGVSAALSKPEARDIVTKLLEARQKGQADTIRQLTTSSFQERYGDVWLDGLDGAPYFTSFSVGSVSNTGPSTAVVAVSEDWPSGTENALYTVQEIGGALLVDDWRSP